MDRQSHGTSRLVRTVALWAVAFALAVIMTWPLASDITRLGRTENSGDARFAVWNVAWVAHALLTDAGAVYHANIFHPHKWTLAYSEANLGAGLLAVPVWAATRNPFTSHNVVVLFAFASAFVATWFLVRRLTGDGVAAAVAGILYAFCPYLFSHTAHIQLLMAVGIPLSMLAFHALVDAPSVRRGVWLGLALAASALLCAYYGIFSALMVGYGTILYARTRRSWRLSPYWIAIGAGAIVSLGIVVPFFLPYLTIQQETGFARSLDDARMWAATGRSYLASAAVLHRWMLPIIGRWGGEVLFPGFVATILGGLGLFAIMRARRREPAAGMDRDRETALLYTTVGIVSFWATLGPAAGLYTVLYRLIPVFSFLRAPGRMGLVVMLCLAVLAGFGVRYLRSRFGGRHSVAIGMLACAAALVDLAQIPFDWRAASPFPKAYAILATLPRGPVVEFPFYDRRIDYHLHTRYMLASTQHWQPLVNGYSDHTPSDFRTLAPRLASFPSSDAFEEMRQRRVRYITINRSLYGGPAAADVERRLEPFRPYLKELADADGVLLLEVTGWPK